MFARIGMAALLTFGIINAPSYGKSKVFQGEDQGSVLRFWGSHGESYSGTQGETPDAAKDFPAGHRASSRPYRVFSRHRQM